MTTCTHGTAAKIVDKAIEDWLIKGAMADCITRKTWANWRWYAGVIACATVL